MESSHARGDTDKTGTRRANFVVQPCLAAGFLPLGPFRPGLAGSLPAWKVNERLPAGTSDSPRRRPARNGNPAEKPRSIDRRREKDRPKSLNECNLVAPGEGKTGPRPAFLKPEESRIPQRFGRKGCFSIHDERDIYIYILDIERRLIVIHSSSSSIGRNGKKFIEEEREGFLELRIGGEERRGKGG